MVDFKAQKSNSFGTNGNGVKKTNEDLISTANFTKPNKSKEEITRCFLVSNILYINNLKTKNNLILDENNVPIYKKYLNELGGLINENYLIYFGKSNEKNPNKIIESKNTIIQLVEEISRDNSFIKILSNLNEYTFEEMKLLYSISKTTLIFAISGEPVNLKNYIFLNINKLVDSILENIKPSSLKLESVVYIVCKILRLLFKNKPFLEKILSFDLFKKLYINSNSEKFVVSSEIFKTLIYMVTKQKVDVDIINDFLGENKATISNLFNTTLVTSQEEKESYLIKRETLIFLNKIFDHNKFYVFKDYFSNDVNNLKMILIHMNDECLKIKLESINLLYHFFVDVYNEVIMKILLSNKQNFYQFFQELEKELTEENANLIEKRNFIYYELERLENSHN
jgi:hypothetical protein